VLLEIWMLLEIWTPIGHQDGDLEDGDLDTHLGTEIWTPICVLLEIWMLLEIWTPIGHQDGDLEDGDLDTHLCAS
jgi:hypothetical protein